MRSSFFTLKSIFLSVSLLYFTGLLYAQHFQFDEKLLPNPSPNADDQLGWDIFAYNNFLVVGAPENDKNGTGSGTAYLFELQNGSWNKIARLNPSDPQSYANFGKSVYMTDEIIAVGAPYQTGQSSNNGAVYIYKKPVEGWGDATEDLILTNDMPYENANFGEALHIDGDYIIVGAPGARIATSLGAAFIYKQANAWESVTELARLSSSETTQIDGDLFGASVYIDSEQVLVGAPFQDYNGDADQGSVFVFNKPLTEWNTMTEDVILRPSTPVHRGQFGNRISYQNGVLLVSHNFGLYWNTIPGSAYIFKKPVTGWMNASEDLKISDPLAAPNTQFATDIWLDDQYAYVSSKIADGADGRVFVFENSNGDWSSTPLVANLTHDQKGRKIQMGQSICVADGYMFSGAYKDNDGELSSGSVMVFPKPVDGWTDQTSEFRITAADLLAAESNFGNAIDIYENTVVVGAKDELNLKGIAYVFENQNGVWVKVAKLSPSVILNYGRFGKAVAIYDEWIAVAADNPEEVFMFRKPETGWQDMTESTTIYPGITDDGFGNSVDIYENTVVVGSSNGHAFPESGAYIFEISGPGWEGGTEQLRLGESDNIRFMNNTSVSVYKDLIAIGAPMLNRVYIYQNNNGWSDTAIRVVGTGEFQDLFGNAVSIYENKIAVGSPGSDAYATNAGTVYIYEAIGGDWTEELRRANVIAPNPVEGASFGDVVSLHKNHLLVGAPFYSNEGVSAGAVFDFLNDKDDWLNISPDMYFTVLPIDGNNFGNAIALNDEFLMVSDEKDDTSLGENSGSVSSFHTTIDMEYFDRPSGLEVKLKENAIVDISWQDNSLNEKGFAIEYSADTNFYSYSHTSVEENTTSLNDFYITQQDTIVHFRVRAFSDYYTTPPSEVFSTLITKKLIYTPIGFQAALNADGTVSLYWDNNNEYADEYILEYSSEEDFFQSEKLIIPGDQTKYDSLEVELDQAYYFRLVAQNKYYTSEPTAVEEIFVMITGFEPLSKYVMLYPNPAKDFIYINSEGGTESSTKIIVTDLSGRNLYLPYNKPLGGIDISKIKSGLYFVRHGAEMLKFIKE